jgi:hypothetical protein
VLAPFLFLCAACSRDAAPVETQGASDPASARGNVPKTRACIIEGPGESTTGEYLVHALADRSSPIARVARAEDIPARITLVPASDVAAITLRAPTLELSGWVARSELHFVTRERVALSSNNLFVEQGRNVTVREVDGDRVTAEVPSPFQADPAIIQISCENLAYADGGGGRAPAPARSWAVQGSKGPLSLLDGPAGSLVLKSNVVGLMRVLDVRDGFSHVGIGDSGPWCDQGVVADVWVASTEIADTPELSDRDDACLSFRDQRDTCPGPRVQTRTALLLGDASDRASDLAHVGWLSERARVSLHTTRERFVEIRFDDERITAPQGRAFFAERAAISGDCAAAPDEDGCPCDADGSATLSP